MRPYLVQLTIVILTSLILAACQSKEGPIAVDDAQAVLIERLSLGLPVYADIKEPLYAGRSNTDAKFSIGLLSYDPSLGIAEKVNPNLIMTSEKGLHLALNTADDDSGKSEFSILVNNDSVYKVDHLHREIRLLHHFSSPVCELIPAEIIKHEPDDETSRNLTHIVLNANWIYVVTSDGTGTAQDCADLTTTKRYFQLSLNYQFDADSDQLCSEEEGLNTPDAGTDCQVRDLPVVTESLARAQLVFGWVDDEVTSDPDPEVFNPEEIDNRLAYGFLGYGFAEQQLRFYGPDRELIWSQDRTLQTFPIVDLGQSQYSPKYLAKLTELDQYQYLLQLGLDVFVFDSSTELFAKTLEPETVLTDRSFKMATTKVDADSLVEIVQPVKAFFDDQDLVLIDDAKIFRSRYLDQVVTPETTRTFAVKRQDFLDVQPSQRKPHPFSQFDYHSCQYEAESCTNALDSDSTESDQQYCQILHAKIGNCIAAHNLLEDGWQFITDCLPEFGCSLNEDIADNCVTESELAIDPGQAGTRCSASNYLYLNDMDEPGNNAEFRGFMQYAPEYIRSLEFILDNSKLYITARMMEKEILLRYAYNEDLSAPKPNRENVIFGKRFAHFGIDAYLSEHNLFATLLRHTKTRNNECYKYKSYQRVTCDFLEIDDSGDVNTCTGKDLVEGLCVSDFKEYESLAVFCNATQIADGTCSDNQLESNNVLSMEHVDEDAKWLRLNNLSVDAPVRDSMYLLLGNQSGVTDEEAREGALLNPKLIPIDANTIDLDTGLPFIDRTNELLPVLSGTIESVLDGWISETGRGRFDVFSKEVFQLSGPVPDQPLSLINSYFLAELLPDSATNVADSYILRPITRSLSD